MKIVIPSYSKTYWCLRPFTHLFNKYWNTSTGNAVILHYPKIPFNLPNNFELHQVHYKDYPRHKWADGVIEYLEEIDDKSIILLLEDYWIVRKVNTEMIHILSSLIQNNDDILRVDLTTDRLYAGGMRDVGYVEYIDLIEAPGSPYQMSLQAGIWHRENLLKVLNELSKNTRSSWEVEMRGTTILNEKFPDLKVLGTRQYPLRYENGVNDNKGINKKLRTMPASDKKFIEKWINENHGE